MSKKKENQKNNNNILTFRTSCYILKSPPNLPFQKNCLVRSFLKKTKNKKFRFKNQKKKQKKI
jgi:hypothetical protein